VSVTETTSLLEPIPSGDLANPDHYNTPLGPDGSAMRFYEALRDKAEKTPIWWGELHGGAWNIVSYEHIHEIMSMPQVFSNKGVTLPRYDTGDFELMLAAQDAPKHKKYRDLIAPVFSPGRTKDFRDQLAVSVNSLIDKKIADGRADVATWLADEIPGRLTAILLGIPPDNGAVYREWTDAITKYFTTDPAKAAAIFGELVAYASELIAERQKNPGDDLMSLVASAEVDGEKLTFEELIGFFVVLLLGGIHNTARFLSSAYWRLAWDVELRRYLMERPAALPVAVDEMIRFYTPATIGRLVLDDVEIGGIKMKKDQMVYLWLPSANRDRSVFANPDTLIPDRTPNRHLSLGVGIHRCIGAHLVRVETTVAITEFLKRVPEFALDPDVKPEWQCGQVAGFIHVPIVFAPGQALG
jgi:cytochrome P450